MPAPTVVGTPAFNSAASPFAYSVHATADFLLAFQPISGASGSPPALTATYAAAAMTSLVSQGSVGEELDWAALHRRVAPATGSNNLAYTEAGGARYGTLLVALDGVDAGAAIRDNECVSSYGATTVAASVTSTTDDLCVMFVWGLTSAALTAGAGETVIVTDNSTGYRFAIVTKAGGAGTTSFAPTFAASELWLAWAVSVSGASGGATIVDTTGASAGVGAATGISGARAGVVGAVTGVATAAAIAAALALTTGAAAGVAAASGVAAYVVSATGSSAGGAAATGSAAALGAATGVANGVALGAGVSGSWAGVTGAVAGVGAASGVGAAIATTTGASAGTSTADGISEGGTEGTGTAAGVATVTGVGAAITTATGGSAAGVAAATGTAAAVTAGTGAATGAGAASGTSAAVGAMQGASAGVATASAVSGAIAGVTGATAGVATATGTAEDAADVDVYTGKYRPEWQGATRDLAAIAAQGFAAEHASARLSVGEAGR